jgi:hypothetical protein
VLDGRHRREQATCAVLGAGLPGPLSSANLTKKVRREGSRGSVLHALVVLPLCIPLLIFGAPAIEGGILATIDHSPGLTWGRKSSAVERCAIRDGRHAGRVLADRTSQDLKSTCFEVNSCYSSKLH